MDYERLVRINPDKKEIIELAQKNKVPPRVILNAICDGLFDKIRSYESAGLAETPISPIYQDFLVLYTALETEEKPWQEIEMYKALLK